MLTSHSSIWCLHGDRRWGSYPSNFWYNGIHNDVIHLFLSVKIHTPHFLSLKQFYFYFQSHARLNFGYIAVLSSISGLRVRAKGLLDGMYSFFVGVFLQVEKMM